MKWLLCIPVSLFACCDFLIENVTSHVVGRSMEFEAEVSSEIVIIPKESRFVSRVDDGKVGMSWTTKYASMGMGAFGMDSLVDGLNEEGLSFAALWFPGSEYPKLGPPNQMNRLSLMDVGNYLLGMCASVDDAISALRHLEIYPKAVAETGGVPPLHFSLHDKSGKSCVIEFLDGKMVISDNPVHVLTNAPSFSWQLQNLRNYVNLTAENAGPKKMGSIVLKPTGQGTGMMGIPGDWTPPSRFVRIAFFREYVDVGGTPKEAVIAAMHLLNTVDIPYGVIRGNGKSSFDYTQWAVVKDLDAGVLLYRTYKDFGVKEINLHKETKVMRRSIRKIPMVQG